jgi:zinc protease
VERYLASLPSRNDGMPSWRDPGIHFPEGTVEDVVHAGREPKAHTTITWPAKLTLDEMEMFAIRKAVDVLEIRLREILREELGTTYSVGAVHSYMAPYREFATLTVTFGSAPEDVDRMVDIVFDEIARLKEEGPSAEEVQKVAEQERRDVETGLKENNYWIRSLRSLYVIGWEPRRILERLSRVDDLTGEAMQTTLGEYFPPDRFVRVSLLPQDGDRP